MDSQPMKDFDESWLSAYLDGELAEEQARHVEELLQSRPDLQQSLNGLVRVRTAIAMCKLELPSDTRIVRTGPWDAPKPAPPASNGWSMQYPTWLLSLAAMILIFTTLSGLYWLTPGSRDGGMIATTMEAEPKLSKEKAEDAAFAGNSSILESDFSAPSAPVSSPPSMNGAPPSMNARSASPSPASDPTEATSSLAFRSEPVPDPPSPSQGDLLAYFLHANDAPETSLSEQKNTPYSLVPKATGDFLWRDERETPTRSRSLPTEQEPAIVWFQPKSPAAEKGLSFEEKERSADKKTAPPPVSLSVDATPANPTTSFKNSPIPKGLEIRIPAELWSEAIGSLQAKGFEIPEDMKPGDYRFEAIENEGNAEKPWMFRKLEEMPPAEEDRTPAYFSLLVIPAKPTTKSGSTE